MPRMTLSTEESIQLEHDLQIQGHEPYAIVFIKIRGTQYARSVHVFEREPDAREITEYENNASKMKIKGSNAEIQGGSVAAAAELYRRTISRVHNLVVNRVVVPGPIGREEALRLVPPIVKRAAISDLIGDVFQASRISEMEGDEREAAEVAPTGFSGSRSSGPVPVPKD
jgi:hypothetical protein